MSSMLASCSSSHTTLRVGDCFSASDAILTGNKQLSSPQVVPCSQSHNSEVIAVEVLRVQKYPGHSALAEQAATICSQAFKDYVGTEFKDSPVDMYPLVPSQTAWEDKQDRTVTCIALTLPERQGSVKNSES